MCRGFRASGQMELTVRVQSVDGRIRQTDDRHAVSTNLHRAGRSRHCDGLAALKKL